MHYVALPIEGASTPRFRDDPNINYVTDLIKQVYEGAARDGGRVVAGHTLTCELPVKDLEGKDVVAQVEYLFLVMELPGEAPEDDDCTPEE